MYMQCRNVSILSDLGKFITRPKHWDKIELRFSEHSENISKSATEKHSTNKTARFEARFLVPKRFQKILLLSLCNQGYLLSVIVFEILVFLMYTPGLSSPVLSKLRFSSFNSRQFKSKFYQNRFNRLQVFERSGHNAIHF